MVPESIDVFDSLVKYGPFVPSRSSARDRAVKANAALTADQRAAIEKIKEDIEDVLKPHFIKCVSTSISYNSIDADPQEARAMAYEMWNVFNVYLNHYSLALYEVFQGGSTEFPSGAPSAEDTDFGYILSYYEEL